MELVIDSDRAIQIVRDVVAQRGEGYVYSNHFRSGVCTYQTKRSTRTRPVGACLVGKGLIPLGVTFFAREDSDEYELPSRVVGDATGRLEGSFSRQMVYDLQEVNPGLTITLGGQRVLRAAQVAQDAGEKYGVALHDAECAHDNNIASGIK